MHIPNINGAQNNKYDATYKGKYFGQKPLFFPCPDFGEAYFFPIFSRKIERKSTANSEFREELTI